MSKMYNNSQTEMVATWRGQEVSETHQHHGTKNDCKPAPRQGYQHHGTDIEEVPIEPEEEVPIEPEEEMIYATARTPS